MREYNRPCWHQVAQRGHAEIMAFMIDEGVDVGALTSTGRTPLMLAAYTGGCGQPPTVQ